MKLSTIMSSKYLIILPATFFISLPSLIAIMFIFGPLDTVAENHIDIHVNDVQPACVQITLLDQKSNAFDVNITCPEILQNVNRESIEEDIANNLHDEGYEIPQYGTLGWVTGYETFTTVMPRFFSSWSIEKDVDNTPIILFGTAQADTVYILAAIFFRLVKFSFYGLLIFSVLSLPRILRRKKST